MARTEPNISYSPEFLTFWQRYPKRYSKRQGAYIKRKKQPAMRAWVKLSQTDISDILNRLHLIAKAEGDYPRDAVTWLNQRGWEDIELPDSNEKHLPKEMTSAIKTVPLAGVNVNNERNRQMAALKKNNNSMSKTETAERR